jgi:hypothetical protein
MTSQARQVEASRRPFGRRKLSTTDDSASHRYDQASGSSVQSLFSQTALCRECSNQLSLPEYNPKRLTSLTSDDSQVTTSSTMESCWPRTSWDPPPLFQAYPQALRHALLDTPSASVQSILRRQAFSVSGGSTTPTNLDEATISQKNTKKHKRKTLPSVDSAWTRKLYILVTSGYVLQYAADGHHDRLPEKILPLGYNSVAFASDAISGRPYVLQISRDPEQGDERADTNTKNMWSRIGFRTAEEKRMAESFLLVCESSHELDAWMIAVRREIEAHGGAQYRCDTPRAENDESVTANKPCQDAQQIRQSLSIRSGLGDSPEPHDKVIAKYEPLPEIETDSGSWSDQVLFFQRRSSVDSSVNTSTELDDLRESSQCSPSTATGHRLSLDESHGSLSPAEEKFKETYAALTGSNKESAIDQQCSPVRENANDLSIRTPLSLKQVPAAHSEQPRLSVCDAVSRPVSAIPNFSLPSLSQRYSLGSVMPSGTSSPAISDVLDIVDPETSLETEPAEEKDAARPKSTISPLPSRETLVRNPRSRVPSGEHARRRTSLVSTTLASRPSLPVQQNTTDLKAISPTPATVYSIFPKRHSSCDILKSSLESSPAENDPSELAIETSHKRSPSTPRPEEPKNLARVPAPRKMRGPPSMRLDLKSSLEIERPERSPAVTDLHFATNFGTAHPFERSSSILGGKRTGSVPLVDAVRPSMEEAKRPTRAQAATGPAIIGPPVGPPPTRPLPVPPLVHIRGSSIPAGLCSPRRIFLDLTGDD